MSALSQTREAVRQRKSRRKRRAGYRSHRVYLPDKPLTETVRVREDLPAGATPTRAQIERAIAEGFAVHGFAQWADAWLKLKRHR